MGEEAVQKKYDHESEDQSAKDGTTIAVAVAADEEKSLVPSSDAPQKKDAPSKPPPSDHQEALVPAPEAPGSTIDRDVVLTRVEQQKKSAMVKAWEDSEKTKAENKALKKLSGIESWENSKRAYVEAQLKKIEKKLENKKAEYAEKMKNKMAEIHKVAEEKRAMVEAKKWEHVLQVEEQAAKFRATGNTPNQSCSCFG